MECLLPYLSMVTVPHIMVELERMLDYRGVGLARFHCICNREARLKPETLKFQHEDGKRKNMAIQRGALD